MTHLPGRLLSVVLAFAASAVPAAAQDDPRFALLASFPSPTVSFQWELSQRFAIRFEGSYTYRDESTETTSGGLTELIPATPGSIVLETATRNETTTHNGSIGVAGIVTLHRSDQMRLYLAPRIAITRSSQRSTSDTTLTRIPAGLPPSVINNLFPRSETFESSSTSPSAGVSFGAASNIHRRLAIFGEAGFTWNRSDAPLTTIISGSSLSPLRDIEATRTTVNTRAVGGVMILF